ncbi:hypothetical protein E2P81_ATG00762 [Venturia nashicola]|uniref:Uncharacterized protein n=1 Tax=Venturia nashicola TaxID=86259 RepID=A0A4Z1PSP7_9PEZI|nr:hypothetical protein E6O75_ATG00780 [Venturia nashicola]TLD38219.1 hypothetical protein E2P81_ATG00762 [Venturia nashicola]
MFSVYRAMGHSQRMQNRSRSWFKAWTIPGYEAGFVAFSNQPKYFLHMQSLRSFVDCREKPARCKQNPVTVSRHFALRHLHAAGPPLPQIRGGALGSKHATDATRTLIWQESQSATELLTLHARQLAQAHPRLKIGTISFDAEQLRQGTVCCVAGIYHQLVVITILSTTIDRGQLV